MTKKLNKMFIKARFKRKIDTLKISNYELAFTNLIIILN